MASDTPLDVRSLVIYQVFPRNHGPSGTLADITADIGRIAALGADVLYLLPVHPVGELGRKGSAGSPYAIRDYRAISPQLGSEADFDELVATAHAAGLKVMMDVVFNHTSQDSVLVTEHPEFFHRDADGRPYTTVPQWHDIIDLAHPNPELTRYLAESLALWARRGVDGFRCDVASLVPVEVWVQLRAALAEVRPGLLWLAETPHPAMVEGRRAGGLPTASDGEMYEAFDIEYTYDVWSIWQSVVRGEEPVARYLEMLRWQDATLPGNYAKLRYVENHDNFRIMRFAPSPEQARAWTVVMACSRGPFMIYAGQESGARRWPTLFDPDPVEWGERSLTGFLTAVAALKKHPAQRTGGWRVISDEPTVQVAWGAVAGEQVGPVLDAPGLLAVCNVGAISGDVAVPLRDGWYRDLVGGQVVDVANGRIPAPGDAVVLEFSDTITAPAWRSTLLDVFFHVEELGDD